MTLNLTLWLLIWQSNDILDGPSNFHYWFNYSFYCFYLQGSFKFQHHIFEYHDAIISLTEKNQGTIKFLILFHPIHSSILFLVHIFFQFTIYPLLSDEITWM